MKIPETLVAGNLRVVWFARGDRLGHRVELVTTSGSSEQVVPLLESIDQSTGVERATTWPPSPPLTDWQLEERAWRARAHGRRSCGP